MQNTVLPKLSIWKKIMCLALIAINQHPLYPVIILSNRDEFYKRASSPANFWNENLNIFSGRDLVGNGTWLGINKNGRFSLVTNYRNPKAYNPSKLSRGLLVSNYLQEIDNNSPITYLEKIRLDTDKYNGFNLIVGNPSEIYCYSNVSNKIEKLASGIYCLSNHLLNTPWYKVERAKQLFMNLKKQLITCDDPIQIRDLLFPILADQSLAPDTLLPDTGMEMHIEKLLSSIFVDIAEYGYGTYSSSIIVFEKNNISFSEKIFENGTFLTSNTTNITPLFLAS
ncbi:MAG: NRDE family protein [Legionella sp.]